MGSSLEDEYSGTCVADKVDCYITYMIWIRCEESRRSVGGGKILMEGWGCGRGFSWCVFVKCVLLGYFFGIFLGRANRSELGRSDGVFLGKF